MLTDYAGTLTNGISFRDRFNYILDQSNPTPGMKIVPVLFRSTYLQVLLHVNMVNGCSIVSTDMTS